MEHPVRVRIAALVVAVGALLIAASGRAVAIAHGTTVPDGAFSFAVKLADFGIPVAGGGRRDSSCSGGLISPHWVLTAGHCFRNAQGARVSHPVARKSTAIVGRTDLGGTTGHVANVIAVRQSGSADVALAEIDQAVTDVRPLRISRAKPHVGENVRLTGFGQLTNDDTTLPQRLQTGQFHISFVSTETVGMVGTSPKSNTSPCPHDSGGPYFTQAADGTATVVGVVSHGPNCPHTGPDTAARVDAVAAWIQSVIGTDLATAPPTRPPSHSPPAPSSSPSAVIAASRSSQTAPPYWILVLVPVAGVVVGVFALFARAGRADRYRGRRRGAR